MSSTLDMLEISLARPHTKNLNKSQASGTVILNNFVTDIDANFEKCFLCSVVLSKSNFPSEAGWAIAKNWPPERNLAFHGATITTSIVYAI